MAHATAEAWPRSGRLSQGLFLSVQKEDELPRRGLQSYEVSGGFDVALWRELRAR
jgi:hypothetical protein